MGAGYSVVDGNVVISQERMQKIYAKYSDPYAYDLWKKQLEEAARQQELYYKTNSTDTNIMRKSK
jgi:hypothetical protein